MPALRPLTLAVSLSCWLTMGAPSFGEDCFRLQQSSTETQRTLYEYALIADIAYDQRPLKACYVQGQMNQSIKPPFYAISPLLEQRTLKEWNDLFRENWPSEGDPPATPPEITEISTVGNVDYLGCVRDNTTPLPALAANLLERVRQTDDAPRALLLILEITVFVPRTLLNVWLEDEEMGIITLPQGTVSGHYDDQLVAVQGTDFTRLPQIKASLNDLLGGSCVFTMASIVVDYHRRQLSDGSLVVVGHSLGGAAVQHVAHHQDTQGDRHGSRVEFRGYSFNGVGLDEASAKQVTSSSLYSYVVDGEVVADYLGAEAERRQAGTIIRYVPSADWSAVDPVARHRLSAVQDGICACLNGRGSVEISP